MRPGTTFDSGVPLDGDAATVPAEGLALEVKPLLATVPLGAPVRIQVTLKNTSDQDQDAPDDLSLNSGVVCGWVSDSDGVRRSFWPVKKWLDGDRHCPLKQGDSRTSGSTLLRGAQKALFPREGIHSIKVRAEWEGRDGTRAFLEGDTEVQVAPPVDDAHRAAALKILSTPDTLLSLAIGGEQFQEGNKAIEGALSNPVLRRHFAIVKIKRLLNRAIGGSKADMQDKLHQARELIEDNRTVLSLDELKRIAALLKTDRLQVAYQRIASEAKKILNAVQKRIQLLV